MADPGGTFDVEEIARRVGHYRWAEIAAFETLGGWVPTVPELEVKLHLGARSAHHAWHAELWHERLPALPGVDVERMTVPANDELVRFVAALAEPQEAERTIEKLVGAYRVLVPRFIAAYTIHRDRTSPITDAPTIRALRLILQDELDEWRDGELLLQSLIRTPHDAERAADWQRQLEALIVAAGGIAGHETLR